MKKIPIAILLLLMPILAMACPVCERNQPKILKGIVHGAGPETNWDYISVWATVIIAVITLYFAVLWLIKPGEKDKNHIKYSILK